MQRTRWFSAQKEPPVNGGLGAMYELRCMSRNGWRKPEMWSVFEMSTAACPHCQWRGLTKPAKGE